MCDGQSTYQIGRVVGLDRQRVTRLLRRAGVRLQPRGAGRARPARRAHEPPNLGELLEQLYIHRCLTSSAVGALLGMPERRVRDRLRQLGIPTRTRGRCSREDRRAVPVEPLDALYVRAGLSADEVGRHIGVPRRIILRSAHDLGLPVRVGGPPPRTGPGEIELVKALYADGLVRETLARHGVPRVPPGGPIWQRFPVPVRLSKQLVEDLYSGCGLGLHHIELLTGQPANTVRHIMEAEDILARHPGGRSPFVRRWRAGGAAAGVPCAGSG